MLEFCEIRETWACEKKQKGQFYETHIISGFKNSNAVMKKSPFFFCSP